MSEIEDNSAFPLHLYGDYGKGMTLRDYFAVAALQGLLANGCYGSCNSAANQAYGYADAMIEARKGAQP
jgi:hypothetical protein